mgnify:CR=1 FL=1
MGSGLGVGVVDGSWVGVGIGLSFGFGVGFGVGFGQRTIWGPLRQRRHRVGDAGRDRHDRFLWVHAEARR